MASPENENGYMKYAKKVLESYFPQKGMDYGEAGYVSRVYGAQDYSKFMNISIVLASFFIYAFVFLLGMIGILNVISAVSFQIKIRARELAVLKSMGITLESLQKNKCINKKGDVYKRQATGITLNGCSYGSGSVS